ncbi:uncharacterized protein G2W53_011402 [Senna tora]|uniref:Uncharacterized protein n=1 Tax=Senna tora TaxID=362788 RepID=A0A834X180_9FABA|nr:uncharacterized protein G2W53_011402 [Senna tora]
MTRNRRRLSGSQSLEYLGNEYRLGKSGNLTITPDRLIVNFLT